MEEISNGKGKLAETSEEGQGTRSPVEPMMTMNTLLRRELLYRKMFRKV
jgi:hypothetical protein